MPVCRLSRSKASRGRIWPDTRNIGYRRQWLVAS